MSWNPRPDNLGGEFQAGNHIDDAVQARPASLDFFKRLYKMSQHTPVSERGTAVPLPGPFEALGQFQLLIAFEKCDRSHLLEVEAESLFCGGMVRRHQGHVRNPSTVVHEL